MAKAKHVLVVEPTEGVCEILFAMLDSHGYRVTTADGGEAMRRLLDEPDAIDAVVLDATLQGETAASLARHAQELRLPLVMISGRPAVIEAADTDGLQLL
ncbi:MAG TPA: response regulator [Stellaceae bacterium]|jgi:two-component system OmpR family response regulator